MLDEISIDYRVKKVVVNRVVNMGVLVIIAPFKSYTG